MNLQRLALCVTVASVLTLGAAQPARAARTSIPDTVFDIDVSFVDVVDAGDGWLTPADRNHIIRSHQLALQQVMLAIAYLETNRNDILAGTNSWYNQTFGRFYDRTNQNFINGDYSLFVDAVQTGDALMSGTTVTGGGLQVNFTATDYTRQFNIGDQIVIDGQVRTVVGITTQAATEDIDMRFRNPKQFQPLGDPMIGDTDNPTSDYLNILINGTNYISPDPLVDEDTTFGYPTLTSIILDAPISLTPSDLTIRRVNKSISTFNTGHLDQVVATYERIREILEEPTTYYADPRVSTYTTVYNSIFAGGGNRFSIAGVDVDLDNRYAGLSNSDSDENFSTPGTFYGSLRPGQLLWSDDLGERIVTLNPFVTAEVLDPTRFTDGSLSTFLEEFLEVLGRVAGGTNEFILGRGFLDEEMRIPADVPELQVGLNDPSIFDDNGNFHPFRQADLAGYQQIIAAAAEMSGLAGFGVTERMEDAGIIDGFLTLSDGRVIQINPFPSNLDARAFGKFSDVFNPQGIGDGTTGVPPGKQGAAVKNLFGDPPSPPGNIIIPRT